MVYAILSEGAPFEIYACMACLAPFVQILKRLCEMSFHEYDSHHEMIYLLREALHFPPAFVEVGLQNTCCALLRMAIRM